MSKRDDPTPEDLGEHNEGPKLFAASLLSKVGIPTLRSSPSSSKTGLKEVVTDGQEPGPSNDKRRSQAAIISRQKIDQSVSESSQTTHQLPTENVWSQSKPLEPTTAKDNGQAEEIIGPQPIESSQAVSPSRPQDLVPRNKASKLFATTLLSQTGIRSSSTSSFKTNDAKAVAIDGQEPGPSNDKRRSQAGIISRQKIDQPVSEVSQTTHQLPTEKLWSQSKPLEPTTAEDNGKAEEIIVPQPIGSSQAVSSDHPQDLVPRNQASKLFATSLLSKTGVRSLSSTSFIKNGAKAVAIDGQEPGPSNDKRRSQAGIISRQKIDQPVSEVSQTTHQLPTEKLWSQSKPLEPTTTKDNMQVEEISVPQPIGSSQAVSSGRLRDLVPRNEASKIFATTLLSKTGVRSSSSTSLKQNDAKAVAIDDQEPGPTNDKSRSQDVIISRQKIEQPVSELSQTTHQLPTERVWAQSNTLEPTAAKDNGQAEEIIVPQPIGSSLVVSPGRPQDLVPQNETSKLSATILLSNTGVRSSSSTSFKRSSSSTSFKKNDVNVAIDDQEPGPSNDKRRSQAGIISRQKIDQPVSELSQTTHQLPTESLWSQSNPFETTAAKDNGQAEEIIGPQPQPIGSSLAVSPGRSQDLLVPQNETSKLSTTILLSNTGIRSSSSITSLKKTDANAVAIDDQEPGPSNDKRRSQGVVISRQKIDQPVSEVSQTTHQLPTERLWSQSKPLESTSAKDNGRAEEVIVSQRIGSSQAVSPDRPQDLVPRNETSKLSATILLSETGVRSSSSTSSKKNDAKEVTIDGQEPGLSNKNRTPQISRGQIIDESISEINQTPRLSSESIKPQIKPVESTTFTDKIHTLETIRESLHAVEPDSHDSVPRNEAVAQNEALLSKAGVSAPLSSKTFPEQIPSNKPSGTDKSGSSNMIGPPLLPVEEQIKETKLDNKPSKSGTTVAAPGGGNPPKPKRKCCQCCKKKSSTAKKGKCCCKCCHCTKETCLSPVCGIVWIVFIIGIALELHIALRQCKGMDVSAKSGISLYLAVILSLTFIAFVLLCCICFLILLKFGVRHKCWGIIKEIILAIHLIFGAIVAIFVYATLGQIKKGPDGKEKSCLKKCLVYVLVMLVLGVIPYVVFSLFYRNFRTKIRPEIDVERSKIRSVKYVERSSRPNMKQPFDCETFLRQHQNYLPNLTRPCPCIDPITTSTGKRKFTSPVERPLSNFNYPSSHRTTRHSTYRNHAAYQHPGNESRPPRPGRRVFVSVLSIRP